MSDSAMTAPNNALAAKQAQEKSFRKKGIFIALMSGFLYGGYTAFMTQGMATGIWVDYYGGTGVAAGLSAFGLVYTLSAVGAAVNDVCSAVWTLIYAAIIGRLGDFGRSLKTKPGRILIVAAWTDCFYSLCSWSADGRIHHRSDRSTECGNRRDHRKNDLQAASYKGHGWRYRALLRSSSSDRKHRHELR